MVGEDGINAEEEVEDPDEEDGVVTDAGVVFVEGKRHGVKNLLLQLLEAFRKG